MSVSNMAFTAGLATLNPVLMGVGAAGSLLKGIFGSSSANRAARRTSRLSSQLADVSSEMTQTQNKIFQEQYQLERDNLLQSRRRLIRQELQQQAGLRLAAVASGTTRSSTFGAASAAVAEKGQQNVQNVQRALDTGEQISLLNTNLANLQGQASTLQAQLSAASRPKQGFLQSIL